MVLKVTHLRKILFLIMLAFIFSFDRIKIERRENLLSIKNVTLRDLQWPPRLYLIQWKNCVFIMFAFLNFFYQNLMFLIGVDIPLI